jgi:Beta-lactamase superfamily domain
MYHYPEVLMKKIMTFLFVGALLLAACGQTANTVTLVPIQSPTATSVEPTPMPSAATTSAEPTPIPSAMATSSSVSLTYDDYAQVELVTPIGRHILIDVADPSQLIKSPSADDILLTTHLHDDHYKQSFVDAFPGQQIFDSTGRIELSDVTITGLASAHTASDPFLEKGGTNYIFIIDTGGLRIVHFGDIGQEALTAEQLTAIGAVDVAITQFSNDFSNMDAINRKGFRLVAQVKPHLIIPTHIDTDTAKLAVDRWKGYYSDTRTITLSPIVLPADESILFLGNNAAFGASYKLQLWK